MKFELSVPPRCDRALSREDECKRNAWIVNAGWRLRSQIAAGARCGRRTAFEMPVVVAIAVPEDSAAEIDAAARPILELLCRHGVIAAECPVRGLSLVWYEGDDVAVTLEPAPLQVTE